MEGYLKKYKNFVSGYMKCFVKVKSTSLVIQKDKNDKE